MSSYDNMTAAMRSVGVYSLNGQSIVDMELMSYAKELDCISNMIDITIRESIIMTAADEGLEFYEKSFGSPNSTNTLPERRDMLIQKMRLNTNDNTKDGMRRFFQSMGLDCEIHEIPVAFDLHIQPLRQITNSERKYLIKRALEFVPYHLTFLIDCRNSVWADYDNRDHTFAQIDALDMTWSDFENTNV